MGSVPDHFSRSIELGHCGCAITDHGSYASAFDLDLCRNNDMGNKKIKKIFEQKGLKEHPVIKGAELYIYDDRPYQFIMNFIENGGKSIELLKYLNKLSNNPKFFALFGKTSNDTDIEVVESNKKSKSTHGKEVLKLIKDKKLFKPQSEELTPAAITLLTELAISSKKCFSAKYNHITLMAKNAIGHKNLSTLTSFANLPEHYYVRPRIPLSMLIEYKEGIIVTSGCFIGMIPQAIFKETGEAEELIELFLNEFEDDFYLEMHLSAITHDWDRVTQEFVALGDNLQLKVNKGIYELAKKYDMMGKVYLTQDSHYPKKEDKIIQDLLILSDQRNKSGWHFYDAYPMMSVEQMYEKFTTHYGDVFSDEEFIQWCENSIEVLQKVSQKEIDKSLKMMEVDYDSHPLENPIVLNSEIFNSLVLKLNLNSEDKKVDRKVLNDQIRKMIYLELDAFSRETLDVDHSLIYEFLNKHQITDHEKTEEQKRVIKNIEDEINSYEKKYKNEVQVVRTLRLSLDERFPDLSRGLRLLLRTSFFNGKVDFSKAEYRSRFFFELDTIQFNGMTSFADYFMTFEDLVRFIIEMEELRGGGRGSAAGCLVSYALDITDVDPVKRDLPFWRFLLRERIGLLYPYIDGYLPDEVGFFKKLKKLTPLEHDDYFEKLWTLLPKKENFTNEEYAELRYLRTNSLYAAYLVSLIEGGVHVESNEHNTHIGYLLGLCGKPEGSVKESPRGVPDIDFDSSCRDLLIEYLIKSCGREQIAVIGSYGTLKVKSAMKVVFRVKSNIAPADQNKITALFDKVKFNEEDNAKGELYKFDRVCEEVSEFREFWELNPDLMEYTTSLLGAYSQVGVHACGVLISNYPIYYDFPCRFDSKKGLYIVELDKDQSETFGGMKMDLLGLSTLEIVRDTARLIKERHGVDFFAKGKLESVVDENDIKTLEVLASGDTLTLFQANTPVQTETYKSLRVKPEDLSVEDCSAINAIDRPGPMGEGFHHSFVRRKNKEETISYLDDSLIPYLENTLGLIVYQEQVMEIIQNIGGCSPFTTDKIRKAMGKKKMDLLQSFKGEFLSGAIDSEKLTKDKANTLWDQMAKFGEYCFNRAHALAYGFLTYQCAYFKAHYPTEWIAANFSEASRGGKKEDFKLLYNRWNDLVNPPSVMFSKDDYYIERNQIYMPIHSISGVGIDVSKKLNLIAPFEDFEDFIIKLKINGMENIGLITKLILAGACDDFIGLDQVNTREIDTEDPELKGKLLRFIEKNQHRSEDSELIKDLMAKIEIGIPLDDDEKEFLLSLESEERDLLRARREMLEQYIFSLRPMKLKPNLTAWMKQNPGKVKVKHLYHIYRNNSLKNTPFDSSNLKIKKKKPKSDEYTLKDFDALSYCDNLPIKKDPTPKEREGLEKLFAPFKNASQQRMMIHQLELLGFTSYDFKEIFEKETENFKQRYHQDIAYPNEVIEARTQIESIFNQYIIDAEEIINSTDDVTEIIIDKAPLVVNIIGQITEAVNNNKINNVIIQRIKAILNTLDSKTKTVWLAAISIHLESDHYFISKNYSDNIQLNLKNRSILTDEAASVLKNCRSISKKEVDSIQSESGDQLILKLLDFKAVFINLCALHGGSAALNAFTKEDDQKLYINTFKSLGIDKANYLKYQKETACLGDLWAIAKEFAQEVGKNQKLKIKPIAYVSDNPEISSLQMKIAKSNIIGRDFYLFGTIFRPEEKKYFLKEYGKGLKRDRFCKFFLSNENESVECMIFRIDEYVQWTKDKERVPLYEKIVDYMPVIIKCRLSVDPTRNFSMTIMPTDPKKEFHFLLKD